MVALFQVPQKELKINECDDDVAEDHDTRRQTSDP